MNCSLKDHPINPVFFHAWIELQQPPSETFLNLQPLVSSPKFRENPVAPRRLFYAKSRRRFSESMAVLCCTGSRGAGCQPAMGGKRLRRWTEISPPLPFFRLPKKNTSRKSRGFTRSLWGSGGKVSLEGLRDTQKKKAGSEVHECEWTFGSILIVTWTCVINLFSFFGWGLPEFAWFIFQL